MHLHILRTRREAAAVPMIKKKVSAVPTMKNRRTCRYADANRRWRKNASSRRGQICELSIRLTGSTAARFAVLSEDVYK